MAGGAVQEGGERVLAAKAQSARAAAERVLSNHSTNVRATEAVETAYARPRLPTPRRYNSDEKQVLILLAGLSPFALGACVAALSAVLGTRVPEEIQLVGDDGPIALAWMVMLTILVGGVAIRYSRRAARVTKRRVLLVENARAEDAAAALGDTPFEIYGPISTRDPDHPATLAAFGAAGIDDAVVALPLTRSGMVGLSSALRDARVRVHCINLALDGDGSGVPTAPIVGAAVPGPLSQLSARVRLATRRAV